MSIKLLRHEFFGVALCLVGVDYINSANAQQTDQQTIVTKAEAALAAKINAEISEKTPMAPGLVARTRKLAPTLFQNTPLTFVGSASEGQTWPPS
jgi:hypothetical protein